MDWTNYGIFWTSVVIAVITVAATAINFLLYRINTDPEVIVFADTDDGRASIIILTIKNIGRGVARNVKFECSEPIPAKAFGWGDAPHPAPMTYGPLINGIPSLAPGSTRVITWGQYGGLSKGIGDRELRIIATYNSKPSMAFWSRNHKTISVVDVKSFEGTDISDKNWQKNQVEATEKIAKQLEKIVNIASRSNN